MTKGNKIRTMSDEELSAIENVKCVSGAAGLAPWRQKEKMMKKNFLRNCDNCDNTLNHDYHHSPCRKRLSCRGLKGCQPIRLRTRLRRWLRRFA